MYRWEIINLLIAKYKYTSYLEIGVQHRLVNYDKIACHDKYGVDPYPMTDINYKMTSDAFFATLPKDVSFDIVFIDGLHLHEQVIKDINNSLDRLRPNGTILVHDTLPLEAKWQERVDNGEFWTGDVWKAIAQLRVERRDLHIQTIDTDFGISMIRKRSSVPYIPKEPTYLTWEYYLENRDEMLNVIPPPDLSLIHI